MKQLLAIILGAALAVGGQAALAEPSTKGAQTTKPSPASQDQSAKVLADLKKKFPNTVVTSVSKAPVGDMYEVVFGRNIAYVHPDNTSYFLIGHIFDMATQHDLTQDRIEELSKVDFSKLPLDKAIKVVKGNGKRIFAVFTDPECPYCRQLEQNLTEIDNYTMYVFLYPIAELHPTARAKSASIWCSSDRAKVFHQVLTENTDVTIALAGCKDDPLDEIAALGQSLGVQGTPTLIHKDGRRAPGAPPAGVLDQWLDGQLAGARPSAPPLAKAAR